MTTLHRFATAYLVLVIVGHPDAQNAPREFWLDDIRPLAQATVELERAYGWIVTYEDVAVVGADTKDVTAQVRRDHDANAKNRTIVPNSLPFMFRIDEAEAKQPGQIGVGPVITQLLDAYHLSKNPGKFQPLVARAGDRLVFHVVPIEMRGVNGEPLPYHSPLEARISFPRATRSLAVLLGTIGEKITTASGVGVFGLPGLASNYFVQTQVEEGAQDEVARDVLRRVLIQDTGRPFSWTMRCQPGWGCALNPHEVILK
jgi:hypothetical protein